MLGDFKNSFTAELSKHLQHWRYTISNHTLNMPLSCLEKYEIKIAKFWRITQQQRFTSNFHKINEQNCCRWIMWNKLTAKSVVLLHGYIHRDVYDNHQLHVINDALLMTESVIDVALLQAITHIKHTRIHFFGVIKFCLVYILAAAFLIKYCCLWGSNLDY